MAVDTSQAPPNAAGSVMDHPVVLFDGVCNLCNGTVQALIARDPDARLRFASLQSPAARALLARHGKPPPAAEPDSVVLVDTHGVWERSDAALRIARSMPFPWHLLTVFFLVPRVVRDAVYRWIARNRYRWFGRTEACTIPTPALRARFLPD